MDSPRFGVSFSAPYAEYLGIHPQTCMKESITDLGVKRFRLMSYWNRHETQKGTYDFRDLDWQMKLAEKHGVEVTLCLGLKQPRWPESHWPTWAKNTTKEEWQQHLLDFIHTAVTRYKDYSCIVSYQLENEAMLRSFGEAGDFDRNRLKRELELIKSLDPTRPVIMSTSDSWGIPVFGPRPDVYGFSIYIGIFTAEARIGML